MKNQRRRLLALALVLCMMLPLFATVNAAETEPVAGSPFNVIASRKAAWQSVIPLR